MASDVTVTIYEIGGRMFRLANSQDVGEEVYFTDRASWEQVTSVGIFCIDTLREIVDDEPYPYIDTDDVAWRKGYVYLGEIESSDEDPQDGVE